MNTLSNKQEAREIYINMCKQRVMSACPEIDRIVHLREFYRYMFHSEWYLFGKTKVEDSYLFHMVYKDPRPEFAGYSRQGRVFVLMPLGGRK